MHPDHVTPRSVSLHGSVWTSSWAGVSAFTKADAMTVRCFFRRETPLVQTFLIDSISAITALLAVLTLLMLTLPLIASGDAMSVSPAAACVLQHQL